MTEDMGVQIVATGNTMPLIVSQEQYAAAAEYVRAAMDMSDEIKAHYKPLKQKAKAAHTEVVAAEKGQLAPVAEAQARVKRLMGDWNQKQAELREQNRRAQEAALLAEERERASNEAEDLERAGLEIEAQEVLERAYDDGAKPVVQTQAAPKTAGVASTKTYDFEVTDESKIPRIYYMLDDKAVKKAIRQSKGTIKIPGIKVIENTSLRFSR